MSEKSKPGNSMLWDEILKAIVDAMLEQLFPLFKELYGKSIQEGHQSPCWPRNLPLTGSTRMRRRVPDCAISRFW